MNFKDFLRLIGIFVIISCGLDSISEEKFNIEIPNDNIDQITDVSDFFDLKIIPLETTDSSLLVGRMDNIILTKDMILIVDNFQKVGVYFFDYDGKFVRSIKAGIDGPGVFSKIGRVSFNPIEEIIEIYDYSKRKLFFYNLDGKFIEDKPMWLSFGHKSNIGSSHSVFETFMEDNLDFNDAGDFNNYTLLVGDSSKILKKWLPFPDELFYTVGHTVNQAFYNLDGELNYYRPFTDTIYNVKPDTILPFRKISFLKNPHPPLLLLDSKIEDKSDYVYKNNHPAIELINETNGLINVVYNVNPDVEGLNGRMSVFFTYDKEKNEVVSNCKYVKINEIAILPPTNYHDETLAVMMPFDLLNLFINNGYIKNEELQNQVKQATNLGYEPNPFLFLIIPKK